MDMKLKHKSGCFDFIVAQKDYILVVAILSSELNHPRREAI